MGLVSKDIKENKKAKNGKKKNNESRTVAPKKKQSRYLEPNCDNQMLIHRKLSNVPILKNGNLARSPISIEDGIHTSLSNTCAFDSLAQVSIHLY